MHRVGWAALFSLVGCAHSHGPTTAPADPIATGPFRAFEAPAPLAIDPRYEARASSKCADESAFEEETARETAALDAALRREGGMLLPAILHDEPMEERLDRSKVGAIVRGKKGERWLVVSETQSCDPYIPLVAMNAAHEVFQAMPQMKASATREERLCEPVCRGCGIEGPPALIVVEVPEGAHLGATRAAPFSIDVAIAFKAVNEDGTPMRCIPRP